MAHPQRPVALVTGVGRRAGIGAAIALQLAGAGWDIGFSHWQPYDARMPWGMDRGGPRQIEEEMAGLGAQSLSAEVDLAEIDSAQTLLDRVTDKLGPVRALVMCHCEAVNSSLLDTTVDSFDRHFAVNARASWLLIREFARRYRDPYGAGRVIALTSNATVGNLPYGASKGALDRITIAAAKELASLGITANAIDPGPTDTGWMSPELADQIIAETPLGRLGQPADCANLVAFLCSPEGGWVNGQLLRSDGGLG